MSDSMYEKLKDNVYFPYFDVKKKHDMKDLSREECMKRFAEMNEERKPFMHRYENPFMNIPSYADKFFGMFSEEDKIGNAFGYFCGEQIIKIARTIE